MAAVIDWMKTQYTECARVLRVTKKPDSEEFKTILKAAALGMAIIGLIGFVIAMTYLVVFK